MNTKENCPNLQVMVQDLENFGTQPIQAIGDYKRRIGNCFCECGGIQHECKEALKYFMNKSGIILETK